MGVVTDQALHREGGRGARSKEMARQLISRELRSEKKPGIGQGAGAGARCRRGAGCEPERPRNDGDVSEPYIIIVMGQL